MNENGCGKTLLGWAMILFGCAISSSKSVLRNIAAVGCSLYGLRLLVNGDAEHNEIDECNG